MATDLDRPALAGRQRTMTAIVQDEYGSSPEDVLRVAESALPVLSSENGENLLVLKELIESGQVTPAVDRTYPLADVAAAIRHLLDGHAQGKIVVEV